jgi:membrane protease subunit HflC
MNKIFSALLIPALLLGLMVLKGAVFTVRPTEQVIVTQFGKIVRPPITEPGLYYKLPFVQDVNRFDRRIIEWDGPPEKMPTRDKVYLLVDTFARWRVVDPLKFYVSLRDERSAQSRLDDIIGSATLGTVARHDLMEIVRTEKDRKGPPLPEVQDTGDNVAVLEPVREGRLVVEKQIHERASSRLRSDFGIELLDVRFKRLNYSPDVEEKIHQRMISERKQIAERFRSEGAGEAARIGGDREKELRKIESEAYRKIQEIRGKAEAEAVDVYAKAYNASPEAVEFYGFQRMLETYGEVIDRDTTVVLSTDSEMFRLLKTQELAPAGAKPAVPAVPALPAAVPVPAGQ